MEPIEDHEQPKVMGGDQKVILDERITGETDELDPKFDASSGQDNQTSENKPDLDDPSSELI